MFAQYRVVQPAYAPGRWHALMMLAPERSSQVDDELRHDTNASDSNPTKGQDCVF